MESTIPDQWESKMIPDMHMLHANSLEEALKKAYGIKGADATVTVISDGVSVIVQN